MVKRTKTMVAAGTLALALAGTGAGVAAAQTTPTAPGPSTAATPAPASPAQGAKHTGTHTGKHTGMGKDRGGLRRVEHGEFTVHTKTGDKVVDVQRGVVTAVNATSVTVKSTDGVSSTYTIDPTTKVRKDKTTAAVSQIATNDRVQVMATKIGSTVIAQRIGDIGPAKYPNRAVTAPQGISSRTKWSRGAQRTPLPGTDDVGRRQYLAVRPFA